MQSDEAGRRRRDRIAVEAEGVPLDEAVRALADFVEKFFEEIETTENGDVRLGAAN